MEAALDRRLPARTSLCLKPELASLPLLSKPDRELRPRDRRHPEEPCRAQPGRAVDLLRHQAGYNQDAQAQNAVRRAMSRRSFQRLPAPSLRVVRSPGLRARHPLDRADHHLRDRHRHDQMAQQESLLLLAGPLPRQQNQREKATTAAPGTSSTGRRGALRLAAQSLGRTETCLGIFYRRKKSPSRRAQSRHRHRAQAGVHHLPNA